MRAWSAATAPHIAIPVAMATAVLLRLPALLAGLRGDDYVHAAMLRGDFPGPRQPWDLFRFAGPDSAENAALVDFGYLPWWSAPDLSLSMFRPLPSLLIAMDHRLFGDALWLHHVHSLAWCAAAVAAAGLLYFRLLPSTAAGVATFVFACDEAHSLPATWLANRSTAVASCFGALALWAFARESKHGRRSWAFVPLLTLSLLSGEYAVCLLAYFAALVAFRDASIRQRLRALLPALAVVAAYLGLRSLLGHGVRHSGLYLNPLSDPAGYLDAAPERLGMLLGDMLLGLPAIDWLSGGGWRERLWYAVDSPLLRTWLASSWQWLPRATGLGALAAYGGLLAYVATLGRPRTTLALACGALLALVPFTQAVPEDRLTMGPSLGVSALIAVAMVNLLRHQRRPWLARLCLAALALVHLGWAPVRSTLRTTQFAANARAERAWALQAPVGRPNGAAAGAPVRTYILGAAEFMTAANLPFARAFYGHELPASYRRLTGATTTQDLTRVDATTLDITLLTGSRGAIAGSLYRTASDGLPTGHHVEQAGLTVQVQYSQVGHPRRLRFTFDRPLDDPGLQFLHGTRLGLAPIKMPGPGETLRLSPPVFVAPR